MLDQNGQPREVPIEQIGQAASRGFRVESGQEHADRVAAAAKEEAYGGVTGKIGALAAAVNRGATLGLSDVVGTAIDPDQAFHYRNLREVNPGVSTVGELAGSVLPALASGGESILAKTPSGMLSRLAAEGVEGASAVGGIRGAAQAAAWSGIEGAGQSAGSYISDVALGDRDLTVEGMAGALGRGFAFGGLAGGATFGIEKGTMAARRLFAREALGTKAGELAEQTWTTKGQEILDAHEATLNKAKQLLDDSIAQRQAAMKAKTEADAAFKAAQVGEKQAAKDAFGAGLDTLEHPGELSSIGLAEPLTPKIAKAAPAIETAAAPKVADEATTRLERALAETTAKLEQGATMGELNAMRAARPPITNIEEFGEALQAAQSSKSKVDELLSRPGSAIETPHTRALESLDDAMEQVRLAETPDAKIAAQHEADALKAKIEELTGKTRDALGHGDRDLAGQLALQLKNAKIAEKSLVDDVAEAAHVLGEHEKNMAKLTELVGDEAHPVAKEAADAFRKAESDADRKYIDRTARAVDDASSKAGQPLTSKERIAAAREAKAAADARLAETKVTEAEARQGHKLAAAAVKDAKAEIKATTKATRTIGLPKVPKGAEGGWGNVANIGTVLEAADTIGIPGLPKPHDIPVIGPLLSYYLKYRALKAVAGKMTGRVAASGESKAAALASKTRDRTAAAVDRMLGLVEKAAPAARTTATISAAKLGEVIAKRYVDDGSKPPPDGASMRDHAAARIREIHWAAQNQQAIAAEVRKQMADVADPDLIASAEQFEIRKAQYLASVTPKEPPPSLLAKGKGWTPSQVDANILARRLHAIDDPVAVIDSVNNKNLTREGAETVKAVYPKLFADAQQRLIERIAEIRETVPFPQRLRISSLFDVPLDRSLEPGTISVLQSVYRTPANATTGSAAPTQNTPPMPSIAGPIDLAGLYEPAADRRAARR